MPETEALLLANQAMELAGEAHAEITRMRERIAACEKNGGELRDGYAELKKGLLDFRLEVATQIGKLEGQMTSQLSGVQNTVDNLAKEMRQGITKIGQQVEHVETANTSAINTVWNNLGIGDNPVEGGQKIIQLVKKESASEQFWKGRREKLADYIFIGIVCTLSIWAWSGFQQHVANPATVYQHSEETIKHD